MMSRRMIGPAALLALVTKIGTAGGDDTLRVDPLLLAEAEAVWRVIASPENSVWPGWNASDTPILIYLPGEQDVLINHPRPPSGFVPYGGPLAFSGGAIVLKNGATLIEWDGQNTAREVNGVQTLVLADTLSNRKQTLRGLLEDPRPAEAKLSELKYHEHLMTDPYEQMAMIAHEAFHVFQARSAPGKGANELDVRAYPCLSVKNNVGFALEGAALAECLGAGDAESARAAAVRWLAVRQDRRADLPREAVRYEDGNEFSEGLAKYVEFRLPGAFAGHEPPAALWWAQGFRGFDGFAALAARRVDDLVRNMRGEVNVNNDPYGTSPVRNRLYFSGMAIAAMLDRFSPDWKSRIFEPDTTLTALAGEALAADSATLAAALGTARVSADYAELVRTKTQLAADGQRDTERMLAAITDGPHTVLTLDFSALERPVSGMSFTPFGVRAVDGDRTIYTLVPISAAMGSEAYTFEQTIPTPTLEDRQRRCFQFQLAEALSAAQLGALLRRPDGDVWTVDDLDVALPGVRLKLRRARIEHRGGEILVSCLPPDER